MEKFYILRLNILSFYLCYKAKRRIMLKIKKYINDVKNNSSKVWCKIPKSEFVKYYNNQLEEDKSIFREKIIYSCHPYIISLIEKIPNYTQDMIEDLYAAGIYGALLAFDRYDFQRNADFYTYAYKWILGEIKREYRISCKSQFDSKLIEDNKICFHTYKDRISDYNVCVLYKLVNEELNEFERLVIIQLFGLYDFKPKTLLEIGKIYDISKQRVHQIKNEAIRKLKNYKNKFIF